MRIIGLSPKNHYVYIAECSDGTYYTGYTTDLKRRLQEHNQGKGAKYTRARRPLVLRYQEEYSSKSQALQREYELKQLTHVQKKELIINNS